MIKCLLTGTHHASTVGASLMGKFSTMRHFCSKDTSVSFHAPPTLPTRLLNLMGERNKNTQISLKKKKKKRGRSGFSFPAAVSGETCLIHDFLLRVFFESACCSPLMSRQSGPCALLLYRGSAGCRRETTPNGN